MRSSVEEKQKKLQETELNGLHKSDDEDKSKIRGNPNLIYESQLIAGWEPSGVPVSKSFKLAPYHFLMNIRMRLRLQDVSG